MAADPDGWDFLEFDGGSSEDSDGDFDDGWVAV